MTMTKPQPRLCYFRSMFAYEEWANAQVLAYVEAHPGERRLLDIFGHLIADVCPWLCLLRGETVPVPLDCTPHWSVEECRENLRAVQGKLAQVLGHLAEEDLDTVIHSPGPAGQTFANTIIEILTQIMSHGQHHRGQIEYLVEQGTGTYLPTSYMPYLRLHSRATSLTMGPESPSIEECR